ncbi:hypothetical protein IQ266_19480 [filamentous cyanobacterium LEGE 11480]|uniref:Uncharacterized protein n=1 Tax=Romeriopsis navalis LEGE 11480 TaxID=2777977 RepID=A0A928Z3W4_9CYAN|nr:hypothetical protein [Romeriopsis navalis]MBE9031921.1 hypothetical protein [Romeriopsis navalis LEGE 11480]
MEFALLLAQSSSYEAGKQIGRILGIFIFPVFLMLIFGSVNYIVNRIKGKAISFKQAILARWVILTSVILWIFGLVGQFAK